MLILIFVLQSSHDRWWAGVKPQIYQHQCLACYYLSHARFEHFLEMNVLLCVRLIYQLAVEKDNAMTPLTRDTKTKDTLT